MVNVLVTLKRRVEMLGMLMEGPLQGRELRARFGTNVATLKRDIQAIREMGIAVQSDRKKGVTLPAPPRLEIARDLLAQYLGICTSTFPAEHSTADLIRHHRQRALSLVVALQRSIEESHVVLTHIQNGEELRRDVELSPLGLFQSEHQWRLLAMNDDAPGQYPLIILSEVRDAGSRFKRMGREQIETILRNSFRGWVGPDRIRVRIHLTREWAARLRPRQLIGVEDITDYPDGSVDFEATVGSLREVAHWALLRGAGVIVLEPYELKRLIVELAKGALKNYGM